MRTKKQKDKSIMYIKIISLFFIIFGLFVLVFFVWPYPQFMKWITEANTNYCKINNDECGFYDCMMNLYSPRYRSIPAQEYCDYKEKYFRCKLTFEEFNKIEEGLHLGSCLN